MDAARCVWAAASWAVGVGELGLGGLGEHCARGAGSAAAHRLHQVLDRQRGECRLLPAHSQRRRTSIEALGGGMRVGGWCKRRVQAALRTLLAIK